MKALNVSPAQLRIAEHFFATRVVETGETEIQVSFGEGDAIDAGERTTFFAAVSAGGDGRENPENRD